MIFSIAMGAEYLSYVKSIATFALTFYGYIISVLDSVSGIEGVSGSSDVFWQKYVFGKVYRFRVHNTF